MKINAIENKKRFINLLRENVTRPGIEDMITYLEQTDFFRAPCSTKFHLNVPGGLCQHSLNVYEAFITVCSDFGVNIASNAESLTIMSLLHDVCKANFYKPTTVSKKIGARWEQVPGYEIDDKLPLGHGEKSVMIILKFMQLTDVEMLAIRWHMGAFDCAFKGGEYAFSNAQNMSKFVTLLHVADLLATRLMEE